MADYYKWIRTPGNRRYERINGSVLYSTDPNDAGNYNSAGQFAGTMRSISAPAWESYTGIRPITAQAMQAITVPQAEAFYKEKVWDEVQGDSIKSQIIAEMLADMNSSAGGNGVKQIQKALGITQDGSVGRQTVEAINKADSAKLYEDFRINMLAYYNNLGGVHLAGWTRDMNKYYPKREANDPIFKDTSKIFSISRVFSPVNLPSDTLMGGLIFALVFFLIRRKFFLFALFAPFIPPL